MKQDSASSKAREVIERIENAWRSKQFEGLGECFSVDAVIVGPGHAVFAEGRDACAESYREFANNAAVLNYSETQQKLRVFENAAVYTFRWQMTYQRGEGPINEQGSDQLVLSKIDEQWRVIFRQILFDKVNDD